MHRFFDDPVRTQGPRPRISDRLREVRIERYGEFGTAALADELGVPARTWENYERGVTVPGEVMLKFLSHTGVRPDWLLTGSGHRYAFDLAN
jgi:transcriptional regulator with XRE-family HTH domain